MDTKKMEMYVGFTNYQWNTCIVEVPLDMPEESALKYAETKVITTFASTQHDVSEISFIGIYNDNIEG